MTADQTTIPNYIADPLSIFVPAMNARDFSALKADLSENGYKGPPILLRERDGTHTILDGRNRYRACKELGIAPPFEVVTWDDATAKSEVWRRNIVRRQAAPSDMAAALVALGGMTAADIAKTTGLTERRVQGIRTQIEAEPAMRRRKCSDRVEAGRIHSGCVAAGASARRQGRTDA